MLTQNLADINADFLKEVCESHWPETHTLDFKRQPYSSDKKYELLKDVCAFANADGGDLVLGVSDAGALTPISPDSERSDPLIRRLSQTIESGIEPRVPGIQFRSVEVDGGYVLIVRVPASFLGPHAVNNVDNSRRFVMRSGTSTSDMTFDQIRYAFDRTATLSEQARRLIQERNELLKKRHTPLLLAQGPITVAHFVPLNGLAGKQRPNLRDIYNNYTSLLSSTWGGGCSRLFNIDGVLVYPGGRTSEECEGYAQVFRNGMMESASREGEEYERQDSSQKKGVVWSTSMTDFFRDRTKAFLSMAQSHGLSGPAIICFSILHVAGCELETGGRKTPGRVKIADRDYLVAPELWVDTLESIGLDEVVRPLLDTLWQGFGYERCIDFDETTGEYKPRR